MPTQAVPAYGTLIKRGSSPSGQAGPFVTIGEVKNISGPSTEVSTIDVTTHASAVSGNYREFIPSLIDPGTIDVEMNWVPGDSSHANLWTDLQNRTKRDFQILTPTNNGAASGSTQSFAAYVVGMPKEFPTDDVQSVTLSLRITGAITLVVA